MDANPNSTKLCPRSENSVPLRPAWRAQLCEVGFVFSVMGSLLGGWIAPHLMYMSMSKEWLDSLSSGRSGITWRKYRATGE